MSVEQPMVVAKLLKRQCLYAVFDTEAELQQAEQVLVTAGVQLQRLLIPRKRSIIARIERILMRFGEDLVGLQRYAVHMETGRVVLAVPVADRSAARQIYQTLSQHGAYDVT